MIASLGNLATACDNIAKGTPSGVISDPKTINKAVLFAAAIPDGLQGLLDSYHQRQMY